MVVWVILYAFLICATILDCHSGRIPNILIITVLLAGAVWYGSSSSQELFFYGLRIIGFFIPFFFLFRIRVLGGGDVKVVLVIGGLVGVKAGVVISCLSFFLAAIFAIIKMIRFRMLRERICVFIRYVEQVYYGGKLIPYPVKAKNPYETLRLSLFFLLGACIYQIIKKKIGI